LYGASCISFSILAALLPAAIGIGVGLLSCLWLPDHDGGCLSPGMLIQVDFDSFRQHGRVQFSHHMVDRSFQGLKEICHAVWGDTHVGATRHSIFVITHVRTRSGVGV
jgi:hypothetical protein